VNAGIDLVSQVLSLQTRLVFQTQSL